MVNGGRLGEPVRAAQLNNTLTINGENHDSRLGGGITEGFTGNGLDFACGNSGPAFRSENHNRNLIFIHGTNNTNGYFLILDEVEADAGVELKNYLHPANQTNISEEIQNEFYTASIDHYPTVNGTFLSF